MRYIFVTFLETIFMRNIGVSLENLSKRLKKNWCARGSPFDSKKIEKMNSCNLRHCVIVFMIFFQKLCS